ncbi:MULTISPECIES: DUF5326 family protein [unclassified Streptomyces]|uniref:DUF5326 family protein n=1 Tax=unclassified Streptomyces TaxID=2593676 RepID=UPI003316740C
MAVKGLLRGLPWWVKWVAIPVVAVVLFGGVIASAAFIVVSLLFKALIIVALVGGLLYVVRKFKGSSPSADDRW